MRVARFICLLAATALLIWSVLTHPMAVAGIVYFLGWLFFMGLGCVVLYILMQNVLQFLRNLTK